jgi:chromosome segregation ATPase
MQDQDFQSRLQSLMAQISELPEDQRGNLEAIASESRQRHEKMKRTIAELQDSLDYLRLSIKYLVFDLEATRRENEYLRKLLKDNGPAQD